MWLVRLKLRIIRLLIILMQQQDSLSLHGEVHRDQPYRNEVTVGNMVLDIADGDDEKEQIS